MNISYLYGGWGDGFTHVYKCQTHWNIQWKKSDISLYVNYSKYISVKLIYLENEHSVLVIYSSDIKKATLNYLESLSEALLISELMIFLNWVHTLG